MHFLPAQEHAGGQQRQPAAISEREPSPTDAVGNFAQHNEVWSFDEGFL